MLLKKAEYNPGMMIDKEERIKEENVKKLEKQLARLKRAAESL